MRLAHEVRRAGRFRHCDVDAAVPAVTVDFQGHVPGHPANAAQVPAGPTLTTISRKM
jgi:hypothetical protein